MDTVHLVDDHQSFRESTAYLLKTYDIQVREYADGLEFIQAYPDINQQEISCILLDVRMPNMTGLQLQEELIKKECQIPMIFFTAHGDLQLAVEAVRKGAINFFEKPFNDEQLVEAISSAHQLHRQTLLRVNQNSDASNRISSLSPRERQVLDLVIVGKLNKVIADELGISIKTVELHRGRMMEKMGARTLAQLFQTVMRHDAVNAETSRA
jgi:two-component system, LuxR family, response regulator FixJ